MDSTSRFDGSVNTPHAELRTKAINAREHGALGLLVVNGPRHHAGEPLRKPRAEGGRLHDERAARRRGSRIAGRGGAAAPGRHDLAALQKAIDESGQPHSMALRRVGDRHGDAHAHARGRSRTWSAGPGRDTTRTLVVGAHYDHLGFGGEQLARARTRAFRTSAPTTTPPAWRRCSRSRRGVATRDGRPGTTCVFCAFTGEEMGLVGSSHFVDDPPRPTRDRGRDAQHGHGRPAARQQAHGDGLGTAKELPYEKRYGSVHPSRINPRHLND